MFSGLKKDMHVDTKNEYIRNTEVKRRLITELSLAVKELQRKHIGADLEVERNDEHGLLVCCLLEAIYLHGFHEQGVKLQLLQPAWKDINASYAFSFFLASHC